MKIAYFDCFSGISGDMILGALVDAGLDTGELEAELGKLKISGYSIRAGKASKKGISGTKLNIEITEHHTSRKLKDIVSLVDQSDLDEDVKNLSKQVFTELATIEAGIHDRGIDEIHFHEVGGLDSIVDIVGSIAGIKKLGIEAVYTSRVHVGTGFVECQHGALPVPAPATLSLLKGVPVYSRGIEAELVTPTGACLLKNISRGFGSMPEMRVDRIGYGAGSHDLEIPNLLRVYIGESGEDEYERDGVVLIETNIDDMNPQLLAYTSEKLLEQGALDVFMTPIFMKKNRQGTMLSVLTSPDRLDDTLETVFAETATLGVRLHRLEREKLSRQIITVPTRFGEIEVKIGRLGSRVKNIAPEYESCREAAVKCGVPLKDVYGEATDAARKTLSGEEGK